MEVSLLSTPSVPEGSLVSVRAGNVRRQAQVNSDKPLRFPKTSVRESLLKFDILQKVCSGYLVLKPGNERYRVPLGEEPGMSCDVCVKQVDGNATTDNEQVAEETSPAKGEEADDARAYLKSTGVLDFVQALLQIVIKEKPKDPYAFMGTHFSCGYGHGGSIKKVELTTPVKEKDQKPQRNSPTTSPQAAAAKRPKVLPEDDIAMGGDDMEEEAPRFRRKNLAEDPRVEAAPPPEEVADARVLPPKEVADPPAKTPPEEVADARVLPPEEVADPPAKTDAEAKPAEESKVEANTSLREEAARMLRTAAEKGGLDQALARVKGHLPGVREEAAQILLNAVEGGRLAHALVQVKRHFEARKKSGFAEYYEGHFKTATPSEDLYAKFPQYRPAKEMITIDAIAGEDCEKEAPGLSPKSLAKDPKVETAPPPEQGEAKAEDKADDATAEAKEAKPAEESKQEAQEEKSAPAAPSKDKKSVDSLRAEAAQMLRSAANDGGKLEKALAKVKGSPAPAEKAPAEKNTSFISAPAGQLKGSWTSYYWTNFATAPAESWSKIHAGFPKLRPRKLVVSDEAIMAVVEQIWEEYDVDKNGSIDKEEGKKFVQGTVGKLNEPMSEEAFELVFGTIDKNHNSLIEKAELVEYIKNMYFK